MMWSQVKARFEAGLADGLRGNLNVHVTSYGGLMKHGRGWLIRTSRHILISFRYQKEF
jgi:hypothetical protein